jgi:hypothetical protein
MVEEQNKNKVKRPAMLLLPPATAAVATVSIRAGKSQVYLVDSGGYGAFFETGLDCLQAKL